MATSFPWPSVGERFGHLVVLETEIRYPPSASQIAKGRPGARAALVQCDCGREPYTVTVANLHHGIWPTRSCRHCARVQENVDRGNSSDPELRKVLILARKRAWRDRRPATVDDVLYYVRRFEAAS